MQHRLLPLFLRCSFNFSTFQASLEYLRSSGIKDLLKQAQERSGNDEALRHFEAFASMPELDQMGGESGPEPDENRKSQVFMWMNQGDQTENPPAQPQSPVKQTPSSPLARFILRRGVSEAKTGKPVSTTSGVSVFQLRRSHSSGDGQVFTEAVSSPHDLLAEVCLPTHSYTTPPLSLTH